MKKKIALVVQRYGLEVNGGSELSCRLIAERLKEYYDVEVLTTKAIDYVTWENYYSKDKELINGVTVHRFNTDIPRNQKHFEKVNEGLFKNPKRNIYDELEWMKAQGPISFDLLEYLSTNSKRYDKIIFFTYLYFTTYFGLQQVPEKSILIPTAHDEPYIYFSIFKSTFHLPKFLLFLTEEEKAFVHKTFSNYDIPNDVIGLGIDVPENYLSEERFREKFGIHDPYVIYVGRIDESKGCKEMIDYFMKYKKKNKSNLKMVLVGKSVMKIPEDPSIISLGFVSEEEKFGAINSSKMLLMPSKFESFSIALLEAMYLKKPVLVNGQCDVLVGHCTRGNAGLYYMNYKEFEYCLNLLVNENKLSEILGVNGHKYVKKNYSWPTITDKLVQIIEQGM